MRIRNFGFAAADFTPQYLGAIEEVLDPTSPRKTIVLGVTPLSLTAGLAKKNEFVLNRDQPVAGIVRRLLDTLEWHFRRMDVSSLPTFVFRRFDLYTEFHEDGWVAIRQVRDNCDIQLPTYRGYFDGNSLSPEIRDGLCRQVSLWVQQGIQVYGFRPPTYQKMVDLENAISGFDEPAFVKQFEAAGGIWLNVDPVAYHCYDGSHISREAAITLSGDVADLMRQNLDPQGESGYAPRPEETVAGRKQASCSLMGKTSRPLHHRPRRRRWPIAHGACRSTLSSAWARRRDLPRRRRTPPAFWVEDPPAFSYHAAPEPAGPVTETRVDALSRALVESAAAVFQPPGPVLEIGSRQVQGEAVGNLRPIFPGKEFVGCDMLPGPGVDRIENLERLSLPDGWAGTVLCLSVLEHMWDVRRGADEIRRVTAPDGLALVVTLFEFHLHAYPEDYWRFSPRALVRLMQGFGSVLYGFQGHPRTPRLVFALGLAAPRPDLAPLAEAWNRETLRRWTERPPLADRLRAAVGGTLFGRRGFRTVRHWRDLEIAVAET